MSEYSVTCQSYRFFFLFCLLGSFSFSAPTGLPVPREGVCNDFTHQFTTAFSSRLALSRCWQEAWCGSNWIDMLGLCAGSNMTMKHVSSSFVACCYCLLPPPLFFLQTSAPTCLYALWITHQNRIHIHQWRITVLSVRSSPYRLFCHVGILFSIKALLQYTSMVVYNN